MFVPDMPTRAAYPLDEAAALLGGISLSSLKRLIRAGKLATVRLGERRVGVAAREIDDYLRRETVTVPSRTETPSREQPRLRAVPPVMSDSEFLARILSNPESREVTRVRTKTKRRNVR